MLRRFLIWELLCKWWVTTADHSLLSVLYLYDSFFSRYVTPQMKNLSVMLLAGWFPQLFFKHSSIVTVHTSQMLDLSVSEQWSPVLICRCYLSFAEWSAAVTYHSLSDLRLLLIIWRVTVEWETSTACFFRIKTWKWHKKGIKIFSANLKFFRSITWMPL